MPEQIVNAPMKARVIRFHAEAGAALKERDRVCDLEALKMEVPIMAPAAGTLKEILASPGQNVQAGDPLFSLVS
jgi:biotin carboxyl carrier protein